MSLSPHKIRVGVLRGGPSPEYEVSLKTGAAILKNLSDEHEPVDIFISKEGDWHERGIKKNPVGILHRVDVIVNGLHGTYGEDGTVQKILDQFKVPYTGSGALASAAAMNKEIAKNLYRKHGLKTPVSIVIPVDNLSKETIAQIYESLPPPYVVKPVSGGSSVGVYIVGSKPELEEAVVAAAQYGPKVLVEEFIGGKEATCGVVEGFRDTPLYPLLPIEIRPKNHFFDYESKYAESGAEEICPGNFSEEESEKLKEMAALAHQSLGLDHYSRSDFIVSPRRGIYILETNTLPGLTEQSLVPKSLAAVGSNLKEFLSHLINKALGRS